MINNSQNPSISLGLRENWKQFTLLVLINAFVGGMVGLERTILPELAEQEFGMVVKSTILSFIVVFGITKAVANYYAGAWANKVGRKNLLVIGWVFALPVPLILMLAPTWGWIVFANILLGINQGLSWSSTVVMKIDLVGEKDRGLAMGLNESAGYLAVGGVAFLTGWIASRYGIRPYPFYLGIFFAVMGILGSWLLVKDTRHHVAAETKTSSVRKLRHIFRETTWTDRNLGSITQAGFVNNLNDGMVWGLLPILLASRSFSLDQIGIIVAVYPSVWGLGQLLTGKMADHFQKKKLLFTGMLSQAFALCAMLWAVSFSEFLLLSVVLGAGTALVYPTFLAGVAEFTHPEQRAKSIGVFRLWRDLGYAAGAILTGVIADMWGVLPSVGVIACLTLISALIIKIRMD
ncbi:MFS transporter [Robertkochia flava]|uniref:MFS transporter n=1 Tax=Robertkochia flava TaxID=3447986 RepID=UPI001CCB311F|nr:MFS transporter [Robertkochia marina]